MKEKCVENDIGILCYSPIAQGLLTGKYLTADEVPEGRARTWHFSGARQNARHGSEGCEQETFEAIEKIREVADDLRVSMADLSLAWLIHQQGVTSVLAGGRNSEQVRQNSVAADIELSSDIIQMLKDVTEPLKNKLGDNPDMWSNRIC